VGSESDAKPAVSADFVRPCSCRSARLVVLCRMFPQACLPICPNANNKFMVLTDCRQPLSANGLTDSLKPYIPHCPCVASVLLCSIPCSNAGDKKHPMTADKIMKIDAASTSSPK